MTVYDMLGKQVVRTDFNKIVGVNQCAIKLDKNVKGIYSVRVIYNS
jgi:hypothetical protein